MAKHPILGPVPNTRSCWASLAATVNLTERCLVAFLVAHSVAGTCSGHPCQLGECAQSLDPCLLCHWLNSDSDLVTTLQNREGFCFLDLVLTIWDIATVVVKEWALMCQCSSLDVTRLTSTQNSLVLARRPWLTPVVLATQEAEIRRIVVWSQLAQIVHETLPGKALHIKELVEWLKV
jgi:hypothetical protein